MQETTRAQGYTICGAAGLAALLFLIGLFKGSYWALAIPVAIVTLFALGLVAWVGFTIATIKVEVDNLSEHPQSSENASENAVASRSTAEDAA